MTKINPGPGNYQPTHSTLKQAPKWGFGSGKRPHLKSTHGSGDLGPGQYSIPQKAVEGSKYSIGIINHK